MATDPHIGLALSADNTTQKCYMADTGLLVTHTFQDKKYTDNELYRAILFDKLNVNEGMLMENIVAQMLRHRRSRLYFYSRSDSQTRENHMEIDFLITEGKKIAPVEVKSGNYRSHSSLDKFRKHFSSVIGNSYILYTKDVMIKDGIIHLPLYMANCYSVTQIYVLLQTLPENILFINSKAGRKNTMTDTKEMALQEEENIALKVTSPPSSLSREQMLADTDQFLAEFALDYKRMSE